jgi:hypothetical protein
MPTIRLIRQVDAPDGRGPRNGQFALQRLLRQEAWPWLAIGGEVQPGEIPWAWSFEDAEIALAAAVRGEPFILGPNVLFMNSRCPRSTLQERLLCEARSCRLLFTESDWYADLIRANLASTNRADVVLWPYPITPLPDKTEVPGSGESRPYEVLIYAKSGFTRRLLRELGRTFRRSVRVIYGYYDRQRLLDLAVRSSCCLYFSDDDRGPLALAEILLCGCPAIGVARGAPWIEPGVNGVLVDSLQSVPAISEAVRAACTLDREAIAARAREQFGGPATVRAIRAALEPIAVDPTA